MVHFKKNVVALVFALVFGSAVFAQTSQSTERVFSRNITKSDVNPINLRSILTDSYSNNELDSDGDLLIRKNGISAYVFVEESQILLKFITQWSASDSISDTRAIKLVNKWNEEKVFATAYFTTNKRFRLEYYLSYECGVNAENFNDSLDWFFALAKTFGQRLEEEDAL